MIAVSLALTLLLPASALAQSLLSPPKVPVAGQAVADTETTLDSVVDQVDATIPAVPEEVLNPPPDTAPQPGPEPPAPTPPPGGSTGTPPATTDTPSSEPAPASGSVPAAEQGSAGSSGGSGGGGNRGDGGGGPGGGGDERQVARGATAAASATDASASSKPGKSDKQEGGTTVLERFINVIPTGVKIALAVLAALFLIAAATAARSRRQLATARQRAVTDGLTGVPNRRHVDEVIERLLADSRRTRRPLSAILFDLDRFKAINDNHGHAVGDQVLRATADAVRELLRGGDHVARFGGEEFVVLLPETSGADALLVAEKMRTAIAGIELDALEGGFFTASFGVAAYPDDGASSDELFSAADEALYRAKEGGRNRVERPSAPLVPQELALV